MALVLFHWNSHFHAMSNAQTFEFELDHVKIEDASEMMKGNKEQVKEEVQSKSCCLCCWEILTQNESICCKVL